MSLLVPLSLAWLGREGEGKDEAGKTEGKSQEGEEGEGKNEGKGGGGQSQASL